MKKEVPIEPTVNEYAAYEPWGFSFHDILKVFLRVTVLKDGDPNHVRTLYETIPLGIQVNASKIPPQGHVLEWWHDSTKGRLKIVAFGQQVVKQCSDLGKPCAFELNGADVKKISTSVIELKQRKMK